MKSLICESKMLIIQERVNIFLYSLVLFQVLHVPEYGVAHLIREELNINDTVGSVVPDLLVLKLITLCARNEKNIVEI